MVSPAGGPNNRPLLRALGQMAVDGLREPPSMLVLATRDYLRFGVVASLSLFRAMTRYPTLERLGDLVVPVLVIVGRRDALVRIDRVHVLAVLPNVRAATVPGAHALNDSAPALIAGLVATHVAGGPSTTAGEQQREVEVLAVAASKAGIPARAGTSIGAACTSG
jgi:pimeloyl-ACP methyl ester carboxylesterase